jgi:hypothetical protein
MGFVPYPLEPGMTDAEKHIANLAALLRGVLDNSDPLPPDGVDVRVQAEEYLREVGLFIDNQ